MKFEYVVGDWVRFYYNGRLIIAEVTYIINRYGYDYLQTDFGEVKFDSVLEKRSKT